MTMEPEKGQCPRECWSVAFGNSLSNEERCASAGHDNADLKLFDLRTNSIFWEEYCKNTITDVEFGRKDIAMNKMIVTT